MRHLRKFVLALIVVLCAPAVYSYQLGIFEIKPFVTVEGRYDDNITSAETDVKEDFSTFFKLGLEGVYESKTESLTFSGSIDQEVFAQEDEYNSTSQYLDLEYEKEFSSYDRISIENSFTHAERPRSFADEFGRSVGRYDYYLNTFDLGYEHDFTEQFAVSLKYTNQVYDPSLDTGNSSVLNRPGIQADHKFSSRTIGSVYYDYHNYDFDPDGTAHKHSPAVGVRQYLSNQIYTDVRIGSDFIQDVTGDDSTHPNYFLGLFNELDETTQAGLLFAQKHDFHYSSSDLFDNWRVSLYLNRQLTERVFLGGTVFTGGGQFERSGTKEKFNGVGARAGYDINKNVRATLDYMFSRNDSSAAGDDYQKNTVSLGLTVKF